MKRALIVIVVLALVVVAAALVGPTFIDWNSYKTELAERVEAETGRALEIDGDMDFRLLPTPQLSAREVRLANIAGAEAAEMMSLAALDIRVAFLPLLRGEIRIERIDLVDPVIALERLADGRSNWVFEPVDAPAGGASPETTDVDASGDAAASGGGLSLDTLQIENGVVTFRDAASGRVARLDRLNARVSADSLSGPFATEGDLFASGVPIEFALNVGNVGAGRTFPVNLDVSLTGAEVSFAFDGKASEPSAAAKLSGLLAVSASSAERLAAVVGDVLGSEAPRLPDDPFSLRARLEASAQETALNEMLITLGETRATGAVSAAYAEGVQVDVALALNRIDLDRFLATGEPGSRLPAASQGATDAPPAVASAGALALPDDWSGSFNLQVEALTYNAGIVRQLSISASALDGVLDVSRAAALLPGGSDVTVSGTLAASEGVPEFSGRLEAASDNLRALLAWLAVDTAAIPADRLRNAVIGVNAAVTPTSARISEIDLRIDSSRLTGEGTYVFGARPAFSADIAVDRLNADAYRPVAEPDLDPDPASAAGAAGEEAAAAAAPLAGVEAFDTELKLRVGELTYNRTPATGLAVDLSLVDGVLVVREASVQDIGGASLTIEGSARGFSGTPVFSGAIEIVAEDPAALFQFAQIEAPAPIARLSPLRVAGTFEAEAEALTVDVEGSAGGTRVRVRGDVGGGLAEAPMNLAVELTNQSLAALIGQLTPEFAGGIDGAVVLTGTIAGLPRALDVALHADLAGARVSIAGTVAAAEEPTTVDLALDILHPDVTGFLGDLGFDYRPAAINLGGLELKGVVTGDGSALRVSEIAGSIGPVAVIGDLEVALGGVRPRVSANLRTSEIIVDLFLPVPGDDAGGPAAGAAPENVGEVVQGRWSTDPIDLDWLDTIEGEIALASSAIDYGRYRFEAPSLRLVLDGRSLAIAPLTGTLYGGTVELTATLDNAITPAVALALRLDDADLLEALMQSADIDRASGRLAISAELTARGANQSELISALAGSGRFSAREGRVRGVDLGRLSNRLKRLNEITDYLGLIQASLSGGETAYSALDGTFQISNGIVRTSDLKMILDGAEAEGVGQVDLPRWLIDLRTRARLVEHPDAPAIGLDLFGPLDSPRRDLRTRDLEGYLAARLGGAVLRKLLPDSLSGDQASQDQGSGRAPAAGDAVESLLKGLLDRLGD